MVALVLLRFTTVSEEHKDAFLYSFVSIYCFIFKFLSRFLFLHNDSILITLHPMDSNVAHGRSDDYLVR